MNNLFSVSSLELVRADVQLLHQLCTEYSTTATPLHLISNHPSISVYTKQWVQQVVADCKSKQTKEVNRWMKQCIYIYRLHEHLGANNFTSFLISDLMSVAPKRYSFIYSTFPHLSYCSNVRVCVCVCVCVCATELRTWLASVES
jgi:hypothetical protein